MCLQGIGQYVRKYKWLSQDAVYSVLNLLVPEKGRNVLTERSPASENATLSIHCCCNVSVRIEKMNPSQITQLHGSNITVCNVVKSDSISFSLFHVYELLYSTARLPVKETVQTYRHKQQRALNRIRMKQTQKEQTQGYLRNSLVHLDVMLYSYCYVCSVFLLFCMLRIIVMYAPYSYCFVCSVFLLFCMLRILIVMYAPYSYCYVCSVFLLCMLRILIMYAPYSYCYVCSVFLLLCMLRILIVIYAPYSYSYVCSVFLLLCMLRILIFIYAPYSYSYICSVFLFLCMLRILIVMYAPYSYCYICSLFLFLCMLRILIVMYALFCICFHRANWHSSATLAEVFPCYFVSCKANARVYLTKIGHGPHCSYLVKCVVLCIVCV